MDLQLTGKRAVIVGATRGIGRAVTDLLAQEGCRVAVGARNAIQVGATVERLRADGHHADGDRVDAADHTDLARFVTAMGDTLEGIDILVYAPTAAMGAGNDQASWYKGIAVDLMGAVTACEAAIPLLQQSPAGAIVLIGTASIVEAVGARRAYNSLKAALVPYVKFLARDLAPTIRANIVSPGMVYFDGGIWDAVRQVAPERYQQAIARNPMRRMATPEEIANAVAFMASPKASFITGAHLLCDGARTEGIQY
jgi:3-oxoacyl-[acyl-carrier protein] reductase